MVKMANDCGGSDSSIDDAIKHINELQKIISKLK